MERYRTLAEMTGSAQGPIHEIKSPEQYLAEQAARAARQTDEVLSVGPYREAVSAAQRHDQSLNRLNHRLAS